MADPLTLPPGLSIGDTEDSDGGTVSVPATAVWTTLKSFVHSAPFYVDVVNVSVFDPAAVPLLTWRLLVDGQPVTPWIGQRLTGTTMVNEFRINLTVASGRRLDIQAALPTTAPAAFDAVGRLVGFILTRSDPRANAFYRRRNR